MPPVSESLVSLLERSRLLSAAQWGELRAAGVWNGIASPRASDNGQERRLLDDLLRRGWVTDWQADMLRKGHTGFFVGQYRLLDCIGRGGNGHVFRAEHATLGRIAAIKVLAPAVVGNRQAVARFQQEVQAAAALDHPHIVRAYDAGAAGEMHFLAMEYVAGRNLGEIVEARGPLPIGWSCECIRQAAAALQHAHERGMVHRDIKPSNLLVSRNPDTGRPMVKLLDLGLARFVSESSADGGLTHSGQVLGTPDYISPEQAADTRRADIRSDIFSLGCTLFRLLTSTLPFRGNNVMEKLMARSSNDAPLLRSVRPDAPPELESVLQRMLDRDPARRHQTPGEVAAALSPFAALPSSDPLARSLPPVRSRAAPAGDSDADANLDRFLERVAAQMDESEATVDIDRRGPARESPPRRRLSWRAWSVAAVGVVGLVIGGVWTGTRIWDAWGAATLIVDWPAAERSGARWDLDRQPLPLATAGELVLSPKPGTHHLRLEREGYEPIELPLELTRGEVRGWRPEWKPTDKTRRRLEFEQLRRQLATRDPASPGELEGDRHRCLAFIREHRGTPEALDAARVMSRLTWPLDRLQRDDVPRVELLSAGVDDPAPRELVSVLGDSRLRHWNEVTRVAVSPDGQWLASAGRDGTIRVWESSTGNLRYKWLSGLDEAFLEFSPKEPILATAAAGRDVALWNLADGSFRATLAGCRAPFAFSPDGQWLLADAGVRGVGLWRIPSGTLQVGLSRRSTAGLQQLRFASGGDVAAAEYADETVDLLDLKSNSLRFSLTGVRRPLFDDSGARLAAQFTMDAMRGDLGLWESATGMLQRTLDEAGEPLAFDAAGQTLVTTRPGRVMLWNVESGTELKTFRDVPEKLAVSPDRQWLVAGDPDFGGVQFWNLASGRSYQATGHRRGITDIAFMPDSQAVVTASRDHSLKVWTVAQGSERPIAGRAVGPVDVSPDGTTLAFASDDGSLKLWDVATGKASRTLVGDAKAIRDVRFSPTGRFVACVGDWGFFQYTLRIWDATSGAEVALAGDAPGTVQAFQFHPAGRRLAVATAGRPIAVFDLELREAPTHIDAEVAEIRSLAFSPTQPWLAIAGSDRSLLVRDAHGQQDDRPLSSVIREPLTVLAFSPDGRFLSLGRGRDEIVIRTLERGDVVRTLAIPGRGASSLSFRLDGERLAAANDTGRVFVWDLSAAHQPDSRQPAAAPQAASHALTLGPLGGILGSVVFAPDGRHLLTENGNGTVYVLRLEEGGD